MYVRFCGFVIPEKRCLLFVKGEAKGKVSSADLTNLLENFGDARERISEAELANLLGVLLGDDGIRSLPAMVGSDFFAGEILGIN